MTIQAPPKTIGEYLALPYRVEVSHDEDGYFASVVELPGCMTWTDRAEDLWPLVEDAKRSWIEVALKCGDPIPLPDSVTTQSLRIKLPDSLRRAVDESADRDGLSVDEYVSRTLARAVGT